MKPQFLEMGTVAIGESVYIYILAKLLTITPCVKNAWLYPESFFHTFLEAEDNRNDSQVIVRMQLDGQGWCIYEHDGKWTSSSLIYAAPAVLETPHAV